MAGVTGARGLAPAFWFDEIYDRSIATADYYPGCAADVTATWSDARIGDFWNGFFVRPDADGALYVITLRQYENNKKSVTGLVPTHLRASANQWEFIPVVKVFAHNDGTYASAASNINIAIAK
jgi:hypothetical protein